jgi:hypothetical protein
MTSGRSGHAGSATFGDEGVEVVGDTDDLRGINHAAERRDDALARRFDLEREYRLEPHIEVVLLYARSQDVLRRTHARYFKTVQELVQSA